MAAPKKSDAPVEITVVGLQQGQVTFNIVGLSPLIYNCVSQKAQRELLMPRGRLSTADKSANMKHDPISEYRASVYRRRSDEVGPTRLIFPSPAFKASMAAAALDMPGSASKAQMGRLTYVEGTSVDIYGVPQLHMSIVRMADVGKTPDVRTRAILPQWCASVTMRFMKPMLTAETVSTLFAAAGIICGVGDFRQQKGKGSYGQFEQRPDGDPEFLRIKANGGMAEQDEALNADLPCCYDDETEELLSWFQTERTRRGRDEPAKKKGKKEAKTETEDADADESE